MDIARLCYPYCCQDVLPRRLRGARQCRWTLSRQERQSDQTAAGSSSTPDWSDGQGHDDSCHRWRFQECQSHTRLPADRHLWLPRLCQSCLAQHFLRDRPRHEGLVHNGYQQTLFLYRHSTHGLLLAIAQRRPAD